MKEAEGPDGHVFEFPDDTPEEVISRTIREHYAQNSARQPGQLDWDAQGRLINEQSGRAFADEPRQAPREPPRQPRVSTAEDIGRSFSQSGLQRGVAGLFGLPTDLSRMFAGWVADNTPEGTPWHERAVARRDSRVGDDEWGLRGSAENVERIEEDFGPLWEPQTTAGEYAETVGEFAPNAFVPGSIGARMARTVVPAAASEAGGQLTEGTELEPWARFFGALLGGAATEGAIGKIQSARPRRVVRDITQELADAGMSAEGVDGVIGRMRAGESADEIRGAIAAEVGDVPLERMPNVARQIGEMPEVTGRRLEERFGPMTSGERTGSADERLMQSDFERGSGRARRTIDNFNDRRAPVIADNARRIATRKLEPQSIEGGGGSAAANALRGVYAEMRQHRKALYDAADGAAASSGPINHNTVGTDLIARTESMVQRMRLARDPAHERWLREFRALQDDISHNRANWEDVHTVRRQLNEAWATANPADRRVIDAFKRELDRFREAYAPREYVEAIRNADRYSSEMSQMFGSRNRVELGPEGEFVGNRDIAGARMEGILNADVDERAIARMFINQDGLPASAGTALARRLRQINDDLIRNQGRSATTMDESRQTRTPYSIREGQRQTVGSRGMAADEANPGQFGVEQPTPELQAVREMVLDELVLNRLAQRTAGEPIPAQVITSRLRNALSERGGREMMRQLFTDAELEQLDELQRYFERIKTPTGASYSGTPAGQQRHALETVRAVIGRIVAPIDRYATAGVAGRVADSWVQGMAEARATQQAHQMVRPPGPAPAVKPPRNLNPPPEVVPVERTLVSSGAGGSNDERAKRRRNGPRR